MDDLISRQAALNSVDTWDKFGCAPDGKLVRYDDNNHYVPYVRYDDIVHAIKHLPSVQPERKWIPCSERLPDMWDERYLVSLAWGGIGVMEYKSTGFHNYGSFTPVPIKSIIAWMPLPEPYKEGEDE